MNVSLILKYLAGITGLAIWSWLAYIGKTPMEPLVDLLKMGVGGLLVHMLQDGGIAPIAASVAAPTTAAAPAQAGFIRLPLMLAVAGVALGLSLFAGCATPPSADQVTAIRNACAIDAGLRPTVTVLMALPGVAKPEEVAAVTAARAVIDTVCANPEASAQTNSLTAVTSATATVLGFVTQMQARKAAQ